LRFHFAGFGIPWPALSALKARRGGPSACPGVPWVVNGVLLLALALDFQLPTYQLTQLPNPYGLSSPCLLPFRTPEMEFSCAAISTENFIFY